MVYLQDKKIVYILHFTGSQVAPVALTLKARVTKEKKIDCVSNTIKIFCAVKNTIKEVKRRGENISKTHI